jgi:protein phosphatase
MARSPAHVGHPWHLLAVADGVGGRRRGDWASHLAVSTLASRLSVWLGELEPPDALRRAFQAANQALWNGAGNQPDTAGAATTLVAVLVASQGGGWWANVGDSRAYLVDSGKITRLTQDHSWVEEQVRAGRLTMEQARSSGRRNVITRSIGGEPQVDVDVGGPTRLERGDVLVVCSDGLHGQVSDAEIAQVVRKLNPEPAADRLVELSNERGGVDNVSVIVCSLTDEASSLDAWVRSAYSALVHGS